MTMQMQRIAKWSPKLKIWLLFFIICLIICFGTSVRNLQEINFFLAENLDLIALLDLATLNSSVESSGVLLAAGPSTETDRYPFVFSGCLLVKEDSVVLPEWLAYHYTTLPLRHLIVGIDPLSKTVPYPIFDKYRALGMNITVWTGHWYWRDGRYSRQKMANFDPKSYEPWHGHTMHRIRQQCFLTECMREHSRMNRTWTILVDTDEYLTYNTFVESETNSDKRVERCHLPDGRNRTSKLCQIRAEIRNGTHPRSKVPQRIGRQNETIAHWIASGNDPMLSNQTSPCVVFPRINYGAQNSSNAAIPKSVPDEVDFKAFYTLQYIRHGPKREQIPGKSLMDASKYKQHHRRISNPHRPLANKCANEVFFDPTPYSLRVIHYSGSFETFMSRAGRNPDAWRARNDYKVQDEDPSLLHWFWDFIDLVGSVETAKELTQTLRNEALAEANGIADRIRRNETVLPYRAWDQW